MPSKYYYLAHAGKKGMKWGYNYGKENGKRTAGEKLDDWLGYDERENLIKADDELVETIERSNYKKTHGRGSSLWFPNSQLNLDRDVTLDEVRAWGGSEQGKKYIEAKNEFLKTPLGISYAVNVTIENAIKNAKQWFKTRFGWG